MAPSRDLTTSAAARTVPTIGFFVSATLGALLLVCGSTIIYFDHRYSGHWQPGPLSLGMTALGISLLTLTMMGHTTGRAHKAVVLIRNVLAGLVALVLLAIALLLLVGPMH